MKKKPFVVPDQCPRCGVDLPWKDRPKCFSCGYRFDRPANDPLNHSRAASETPDVDRLAALKDIAGYPLPVFTFEGKPYVPLENADYLRTLAKEALGRDDG